MSFVGELWQVYVLFAVSGCFAVASTRLLISLVTANWFTAKRGLAISIALSGSGFGGAILSPIVSSLIVSVGWRSAFLVLAAVCMVAALPITAYSFRTKPSEIGLKPLGENPGDPSVSTAGDKDERTAPEVSVGWSRIRRAGVLAACRRLPLYGLGQWRHLAQPGHQHDERYRQRRQDRHGRP